MLDQMGTLVLVLVDQPELAKLARLGFEPHQIDTLAYLAAAYNAESGLSAISEEGLFGDHDLLLAQASVDTDGDGLTDTEEIWWCTDPLDNNSDSPEEPTETNPSDGDEVEAILKGVRAYGPPFALWPEFYPYNPDGTCPDGDYDGTPDYAEEFIIGTSQLRESSDKDKFDDGQELFGVTFCPAASGPCGYGILPRAEDAAWVSANLPAWVLPPGDSPWVAAFPEPEVSIVPSSITITQRTIITHTKGTTEGTEKTYGTAKTIGTSTSVTDTTTWNTFEEIAVTKSLNQSNSSLSLPNARRGRPKQFLAKNSLIRSASDVVETTSPLYETAQILGKGISYTANWLVYQGAAIPDMSKLIKKRNKRGRFS